MVEERRGEERSLLRSWLRRKLGVEKYTLDILVPKQASISVRNWNGFFKFSLNVGGNMIYIIFNL